MDVGVDPRVIFVVEEEIPPIRRKERFHSGACVALNRDWLGLDEEIAFLLPARIDRQRGCVARGGIAALFGPRSDARVGHRREDQYHGVKQGTSSHGWTASPFTVRYGNGRRIVRRRHQREQPDRGAHSRSEGAYRAGPPHPTRRASPQFATAATSVNNTTTPLADWLTIHTWINWNVD